MQARLLKQDKLKSLVDELLRLGEVIAPRDELSYGPIKAGNEIALGVSSPRQSLKKFFFPQREALFGYQLNGREVTLVEPPPVPERFLFARPCDAAALAILDKVFTWDYQDSTYLERRRQTTIITIACDQPGENCFCVSVGGSPAGTEGSDLLLTPLGDVYHAQVLTERGQALVDRFPNLFTESDQIHDRRRAALEDEWREKMGRTVDISSLAEHLHFDSPVWQGLTDQCLDCSICTFLCPTCHCFDIQDEGNPSAGERVRLWDSCASRLFTRTAVSQPRATHASRYRQRIMHKFNYYPKNFGRVLCVGCGRCIRNCPVGIDITAILERVRE